MILRKCMFVFFLMLYFQNLTAQPQEELLTKLRKKMDLVNDYRAEAEMKTEVSFLNVPVSLVEVYFRKPDEFRIKKKDGISILPRGGININLFSIMKPGTYVSVSAGESTLDGRTMKLIKLLPADEKSDILLATLYIDEEKLLVRKVITTTRENGTLEMLLDFGSYEKWALPDKVTVLFSTKDYKMPKGFTFEYEDGSKSSSAAKKDEGKGRVVMRYKSYAINKGLPAEL